MKNLIAIVLVALVVLTCMFVGVSMIYMSSEFLYTGNILVDLLLCAYIIVVTNAFNVWALKVAMRIEPVDMHTKVTYVSVKD